MYKIETFWPTDDIGADYIPDGYEGNVNLLARPSISASTLNSNGYNVSDGTSQTLFTQHYSIGNTANGFNFQSSLSAVINVTPIMADRSVVSKTNLEAYISELAAASTTKTQLLQKDRASKNIILSVKTVSANADLNSEYATATTWANNLQTLQDQWRSYRSAHMDEIYTVYDAEHVESYPITTGTYTQELNEAGALDFSLPYGNPKYDLLKPLETYVSLYDDDTEVFYGRVYDQSDPTFSGQISYQCEGALGFLNDSEIPPDSKDKNGNYVTRTLTAEQFFNWCIETHNAEVAYDPRRSFKVGTVSATKKSTQDTYNITSYTKTLDAMKQMLTDKYGGIFRIRYVSGATHTIDWIQEEELVNTELIEVGENVISLDKQISGENIFTVIRPVGKDNMTLSEKTIDVFSAELIKKYGRIVKTVSFTDVDKEADLRTKANQLKNNIIADIFSEINVNYVDMHYLDGTKPKVLLGNRFSNIYGLSGTVMTVSNVDRDLINPANDSLIMKNPKSLEIDPMDNYNKNSTSKNGGISKSSSRSRAATGFALKYVTEGTNQLNLKTDEININATRVLNEHAGLINQTANQIVSISNKQTSMEGDIAELESQLGIVDGKVEVNGDRLDVIEGTGVIRNDEFLTQIAGIFGIHYKTDANGKPILGPDGNPIIEYVSLIDGCDFTISNNGSLTSVGTLSNQVYENGQWIDSYTGSAAYIARDHIANVCGEYEIKVDPKTGEKTLVVKSGGGIVIKRDNVEYGLYDEGTLTAGLMVNKINGSTTARIKADNIKLDGTTNLNDILTVYSAFARFKAAVIVGTSDLSSGYTTIGAAYISTKRVSIIPTDGTPGGYQLTHSTLSNMIASASVDSKTNTLTLTQFDGTEINFSKAASAPSGIYLSGSWNTKAARFTVYGKSVDDDSNVAGPLRRWLTTSVKENEDGTAYESGNVYYVPIKAYYTDTTPPTYEDTGLRVKVDMTSAFEEGEDSVTVSSIVTTKGTLGSETYDSGKIKANLSNGNYGTASFSLETGKYTPPGAPSEYVPAGGYNCANLILGGNVVGRIDIESVFRSGWSSAVNGNTYPVSNVTSSEFSVSWPSTTVRGTKETRTYEIAPTSSAVRVKRSDNGYTTTIALLAHSVSEGTLDTSTGERDIIFKIGDYNARTYTCTDYTEGANSVTVKKITCTHGTLAANDGSYPSGKIQATLTNDKSGTSSFSLETGKYTPSGAQSSSIPAGGFHCVNLRLGGNVVGRLDIHSIYTSGESKGYDKGWANAAKGNAYPGSNTTSEEFSISWPNETIDGKKQTRTYAITPTTSAVRVKRTDNGYVTTIALLSHSVSGGSLNRSTGKRTVKFTIGDVVARSYTCTDFIVGHNSIVGSEIILSKTKGNGVETTSTTVPDSAVNWSGGTCNGYVWLKYFDGTTYENLRTFSCTMPSSSTWSIIQYPVSGQKVFAITCTVAGKSYAKSYKVSATGDIVPA